MYILAVAAYCFWVAYAGISGYIFHYDLKQGKRTLKPVYVEENVLWKCCNSSENDSEDFFVRVYLSIQRHSRTVLS